MTAAEAGPFETWCTEAAGRFLQSVMVVDDLATFEPVAAQPDGTFEAKVPDGRPVPVDEDEDVDAPTDRPEIPLDVKTLSDLFADKGLICGVIRPRPEEPGSARVVPAATRADIVLLDWRLGDDGDRVLEFIADLVACDGLRLIAIYTSAGGLEDIARQICEKIGGGCAHEPGSFRVTADSLTIEVYSKEGAVLTDKEQEREIATGDLPDRLVADFVRMTRGIVPSAAVAAIGDLRGGTPRVLRRLSADLDAGYLGHRILLSDPDESGDHLIELIVSELRTVIEDSALVRQAVGDEVIDTYVDQLGLAEGELLRETLKLALKIGATSDAAKEELGRHPDAQKAKEPKLIGGKVSQTLRFTGRDEERALEADRRFATMLSLKTPSSHVEPRLTLGTIVRCEDGVHLICLQPGCDSVRLDAPRFFPFLPMHPRVKDKAFDLLIQSAEGFAELKIVRDPFALRMLEFHPVPEVRAVIARRDGSGARKFVTGGASLTFVAQLRDSHAQDVAYHLAQKVGRVALDQSEVQRLWQNGKK